MADDEFDRAASVAAAAAGLTLGQGDLQVLRLVSAAFSEAMNALDTVDLADLPLEPDLDPGRAPRARGNDE
jgi:hypothetical protein